MPIGKQLLKLQEVMPFRFRVGSGVGKKNTDGKYMKYRVLAYVDARDVMDKLDEVCGPGGWARDHKEVKGVMYCGVSILVSQRRVTKRDAGTQSNIEKEKGEASDSFKRACSNRGLARFLYTVPSFIVSISEYRENMYNMTKFVKKKFRPQLEAWYDENQIKIDQLESKYEEIVQVQVETNIEDVVKLDDRNSPLSTNKQSND